ncbi:C4-dicarboxylate ABC transporter [Rhodovibrio sodomensis]|uniref:TRAP transporter large permease protein n=1 Tax=Rhodovibrio sodomensis TaxID=1088 RepID=A0ABS1DFC0_9PROT|nr:TRAP transporter large permease subunit [Rhodovibrio sodomensis]MBK1668584.1 C4-dicarboxylate ABC transporter [Rhodovibrio sodomensis]
MTDPQIGIMMMVLFIFTILLGYPIAFTLLAMGLIFGFYAMGANVFDLMVQNTFDVMANDILTAVPLFLFMGYVIERANIIDRLFFSIQVAARRVPASMAVAALITCAVFATATGIIGAVVTLMGLLAFPTMLKAGYDQRFASGVICAGGCLGIMIPPSILLIVYSATAGVSVVQLYAGALFPGLMLATMYIVYVIGRALLNPKLAPKPKQEEMDVPIGQVLRLMATSFFPLAVLIMCVLGAILAGLATPTEAAAVGSLGGLVLAAGYRALSWERLRESVFLTARTSAMVCYLFIGSWTFASIFSYLGGHELIEAWILGAELNRVQFLILAQLIIFLLGWPLEWTEIIIIFVPIFLPLLEPFNVDPLFFGILIALNLQTSFLTPPMAMSAYYLKGVAPPNVELMNIFRGVIPFVGIVILAMVALYVFPGVALYLPEVMYGR